MRRTLASWCDYQTGQPVENARRPVDPAQPAGQAARSTTVMATSTPSVVVFLGHIGELPQVTDPCVIVGCR
jgi:hypothetical protein